MRLLTSAAWPSICLSFSWELCPSDNIQAGCISGKPALGLFIMDGVRTAARLSTGIDALDGVFDAVFTSFYFVG